MDIILPMCVLKYGSINYGIVLALAIVNMKVGVSVTKYSVPLFIQFKRQE